jgi:prepilin-type N-terminal cleavage/methylation domain-containing protein
MKKTFSSKKSAFSLIELSIVLIIIGLLIAGITGGASLIKSSELRSIMGEARGYAVAVNSFFTQYDQYPGDASTNVGSSSITEALGDRDNKIEFVNDASSPVAEGVDAWFDLKDIGAIDLALTPLVHTNATTGSLHVPGSLVPVTDIPGSKIKGAGWVFDYNTANFQNVVVLTGTTAAYVAAPASGTAGDATKTSTLVNGLNYIPADGPLATRNASTEIISAPDSLSIDSKIDDGKPATGNVQSVNQLSSITECSNATAYLVAAGAKKVCVLTFRVDVSS